MNDLDGKLMDERNRLADLLHGLGAALDGQCADLLPHISGSVDELLSDVRALEVAVAVRYRASNEGRGGRRGRSIDGGSL